MKRFGWIIMVLFFAGCGETASEKGKNSVKITGNVENVTSTNFIYVELVTENGISVIDTVKLGSNGNFITYLEVTEPSFYRINFNDRQHILLILNGEETEVTINMEGNNPNGFSEVSGSYDTEFKNRMDEMMKGYQNKVRQYQQKQIQARSKGDLATFKMASDHLEQLSVKVEKELKQLIWEAAPSLAAYYGLQLIDSDKNYTFLDSVFREMKAKMPENFHVRNLEQTLNAKKQLAIGSEAPEVSLPNTEGEVIRLSSLRGKYVLIDFWAAWCRPCRVENPHIVRLYKKYSDENFEILAVSLDKTKGAWLKAIEQDGLPWLHVSDLKFWNSVAAKTYQIHSIPATYLVDPNGKIIAKNLRGANLEATLKEIFG